MKRQKFPAPSPIESSMMDSFKSKGFIVINQVLVNQLGLIGAAFIGNCIDNFNTYRKKYPTNDGWFPLTYQEQQEQLHLRKNIIREIKEEVIRQGLLETKIAGCPAKEWYHLNLENLEFLYISCSSPQFYCSESISYSQAVPDSKKNTKKTLGNTPGSRTTKDPGTVTNNIKTLYICLPLAKYLSKIINLQKNYKHTSAQIKNWANEFRILSETNNIPISRIKLALKWYEKHIGGEYVPVIESGKTFRSKFLKLEAAMEREKHPFQSSNNSTKFKTYDGIRYDLCSDGYYRSVSGEIYYE